MFCRTTALPDPTQIAFILPPAQSSGRVTSVEAIQDILLIARKGLLQALNLLRPTVLKVLIMLRDYTRLNNGWDSEHREASSAKKLCDLEAIVEHQTNRVTSNLTTDLILLDVVVIW